MSNFDKLNPMLLTDFYKTIHHLAYVPKLEYLWSYWTPRMSRFPNINKAVMFSMQGLAKEYLIEVFNKNFFHRPWDEIEAEYKRIIANTMTEQASDTTEMKKLYDLQYLPIRIRAVPEGCRVNIKTPMFEITNTVKGFGWLVNFLETYISVNIWHPITAATIAYEYRELVEKYFDETVVDGAKSSACGDFSMRGMVSIENAAKSSAGHLLSFTGTATISSIPWLEEYYHCDCEKEVVGRGVPSLEHSVVSSYGRDGEFECYRHILEDVFKTGPISVVSDTYDYWNVIDVFLPRLKDIIMNRDGKTIIRGDSGDPCDIICGTLRGSDYIEIENLTEDNIKEYFKHEAENTYTWNGAYESCYNVRIGDYLYHVTCEHAFENENDEEEGCYTNKVISVSFEKEFITSEMKGTVERLWDIFGGYINDKGYKVLNEHIGAIYGDGITIERATEIYSRLKDKKFAVNNCTLGIGSYSYLGRTSRDSLGFALKATHSIIDGKEVQIFKDPKTDKVAGNNFKKSQKGICHVFEDENGEIVHTDKHSIKDTFDNELLEVVFEDSKMIKEYSLKEIRDRLHKGKF